jgi:hypothetical protein
VPLAVFHEGKGHHQTSFVLVVIGFEVVSASIQGVVDLIDEWVHGVYF